MNFIKFKFRIELELDITTNYHANLKFFMLVLIFFFVLRYATLKLFNNQIFSENRVGRNISRSKHWMNRMNLQLEFCCFYVLKRFEQSQNLVREMEC